MSKSSDVVAARHTPLAPKGMIDALGQSDLFLQFQEKLSQIAPIHRPVLLMGERGTGKELAASRLHYLSMRWQYPLVTLNCSALSPTLIESELFGHEKGAFTGATQQRIGRFELADQGSLFLDEIGNIPLQAQENILRVVEYSRFERVGSSKSIDVDVRIITATNADLSQMAQKGQFMKDLLDRLSFEVLYLPPLRERKGDISLLAHHFAAHMAFELGREQLPKFTSKALNSLENYHWPGNIRELKNTIERAVYRSASHPIDTIVFNPFENPYPSVTPRQKAPAPLNTNQNASFEANMPTLLTHEATHKSFETAVWDFKAQLLKDALSKAQFNQKKAAQILGMTYHQFRALYRKYKKMIDIK